MAFMVNKGKLLKVLEELVRDLDAEESPPPKEGGHIKGTGAVIGKIGKYYVSVEIDEFDSDDVGIFSNVVTEQDPIMRDTIEAAMIAATQEGSES